VAAAVALYFSRNTVAEAADLRRSTRSDRILDCIGDYAAALVRAWDITHVDTKRGLIMAARLRLEAAIDAVKTPHRNAARSSTPERLTSRATRRSYFNTSAMRSRRRRHSTARSDVADVGSAD
jgi:hypothetical protein